MAARSFFLLALTLHAQSDADSLWKLAEQALQRGDYSTSIEKGEAALKIWDQSNNRSRLGQAENTVGLAALYKGDYPIAIPHFQRSIALARESNERPQEIRRINNLGNVYFYQGQYVKAFETYQSGLARLTGHEKESWYPGTRQLALSNLAVLHQQLGQQQRALDLYKEIRALPLQLKPNIEAQILTNLAIVYRRLGDPQKALETYQQARQLLAKDPNAAAALYTLHNVGVVQALDFHNLPAALQTFTEALKIAEKSGSKRELTLERLFRGETHLLLKNEPAARADFNAALADARALDLKDELWTALYGLGRAQALAGEHDDARQSFQQAVDIIESARAKLGKTTLKAEFLAEKRDVYDALIAELLDLPEPPLPQIFRLIEDGRARNLKELLPAEREQLSLDALRQSLDADTAVLTYWLTPTRLAILWATRDASGLVQRRLATDESANLAELPRALARRDSNAWQALVNSASPLLLDPRLPLTKSKLIIVPDGVLHALPFEVLQAPGGHPLLTKLAISYLPSTHFLAIPARQQIRRWPWQIEVAAFADPLPGRPGGATPFDTSWPRLAYSAEEARAITKALPGRAKLLTGDNNQKQALFAPELGAIPVLHFATHGAIDTVDSRRSRLVFSPVENEPSSQYLFAPEIARLSLTGVELVTLAACESERGRYVRGEGPENFGRLFLGAGAASTVSSLWRVSDQASAQLMQTFYEGLAAGKTKAEALRLAKLAMLNAAGERAHPFYWAPFLLSGDGQSPLSPVVPLWPFAAGAATLFAALFTWRKFS